MNPQKTEEREREKESSNTIFWNWMQLSDVRRGRKEERWNESNSTMASTCFGHRNPFFFSPSLQRVAAMSDKNEQVQRITSEVHLFCFYFFPSVSLSRPPFFVSAPSVFEVARWKEREPKKCERSIDTRPSVKSLVNFSLSTDPRYFSFTKFKFLGTKIFEVEFELDGLIYEYRIRHLIDN